MTLPLDWDGPQGSLGASGMARFDSYPLSMANLCTSNRHVNGYVDEFGEYTPGNEYFFSDYVPGDEDVYETATIVDDTGVARDVVLEGSFKVVRFDNE